MFVALSVITFLPGILLVTKEPSDLEELLILNMSLLFTVCCQIFAYSHSVLCYVWCNLYIFQTATWLHWICIVIVVMAMVMTLLFKWQMTGCNVCLETFFLKVSSLISVFSLNILWTTNNIWNLTLKATVKLLRPHPHRAEALSNDVHLTSVCPSRTSGLSR